MIVGTAVTSRGSEERRAGRTLILELYLFVGVTV